MPRATRLTCPLPDFEIPEISHRRRMAVSMNTGATNGGSAGTAAPVGTAGRTAAPAISEPVILKETPDHGNYILE